MSRNILQTLAACVLFAAAVPEPISAADLGSNCCADLEERIAELEASTVQKGNRKVSLAISGQVGQQIMFWDDGYESNVYIHDLGSTLGSHVKFTGAAQILPDWSAGYVLQLEAISSDSLTIDQDTPNGPSYLTGYANGVQTLQSYWFVKSETYGKLSVGKQSQASDNAAMLVDASGSLVPANWMAFDVNRFYTRITSTEDDRFTTINGDIIADEYSLTYKHGQAGRSWGSLGYCNGSAWGDCDGIPTNVIRYDTPTIAGLSMSASWGEDDMWDIAARYAVEQTDFNFAAAVAYSHTSGDSLGCNIEPEQVSCAYGVDDPTGYMQVGMYLQHKPTGMFLYGAYGRNTSDYEPIFSSNGSTNAAFSSDSRGETVYLKSGMRTTLNSLGATILYGEYESVHGETSTSLKVDWGAASTDLLLSEETHVEALGLGIVQEVDAAAASVWLKYRHLSGSVSGSQNSIVKIEDSLFSKDEYKGQTNIHDFHYFGLGALITF